MTLISVIIGTYNGSKYIETQLNSIIEQTYTNLEIIIVDDASKDNTVGIIKNIAKSHNHITLHTFDTNLGYIKNFERGIALANGDLIALSDQDDWWQPNKIETLAKHINNHDIIFSDSAFVNQDLEVTGERFSTIKNLFSSNNPLHFLIDNSVSGHSMLFKKSLYNKAIPFPEFVPHDWWLTYIAALNNGIVYFDEPFVFYRLHQDNVIASNKTKTPKSQKRLERIRRLKEFSNATQIFNHKSQSVVLNFNKTYQSFSLLNNIKRVFLFNKHKNEVLKILKKSEFKKTVFCFNMFFKLK